MKKLIPFLFGLLPLLGVSQIQIDDADIGTVGDVYYLGIDTFQFFSPLDIGTTGGPQTWDFSTVKGIVYDSLGYSDPNKFSTANEFPGANLVLDDFSFAAFLEVNSSSMTILGVSGDFLGGFGVGGAIALPYDDQHEVYEFPLTYQDKAVDTFTVSKVLVFNPPLDYNGFQIDSARIDRWGMVEYDVDAYGSIQTPLGEYDALRRKEIEYNLDKVFLPNPFPIGDPWVEAPFGPAPEMDTTMSYSWLVKEHGYPIAEMRLDSMGNPDRYTFLAPKLYIGLDEVAGTFTSNLYPNPASEVTYLETDYQGNKMVQVFNSQGKAVFVKTFSAFKTEIQTSQFSAGMYMYILATPKGKMIASGRFAVE